eukprot:TRINITY_DN7738_c0_g1_i1.p1 TRINITY_DN7738_c0_g1~~TRINITY_DN7738_c0_g1_i1.p1  ORF type:complete len:748 (+),score=85.53 TRINITY_DN7738_c0_g1_i1:90-2333(+)
MHGTDACDAPLESTSDTLSSSQGKRRAGPCMAAIDATFGSAGSGAQAAGAESPPNLFLHSPAPPAELRGGSNGRGASPRRRLWRKQFSSPNSASLSPPAPRSSLLQPQWQQRQLPGAALPAGSPRNAASGLGRLHLQQLLLDFDHDSPTMRRSISSPQSPACGLPQNVSFPRSVGSQERGAIIVRCDTVATAEGPNRTTTSVHSDMFVSAGRGATPCGARRRSRSLDTISNSTFFPSSRQCTRAGSITAVAAWYQQRSLAAWGSDPSVQGTPITSPYMLGASFMHSGGNAAGGFGDATPPPPLRSPAICVRTPARRGSRQGSTRSPEAPPEDISEIYLRRDTQPTLLPTRVGCLSLYDLPQTASATPPATGTSETPRDPVGNTFTRTVSTTSAARRSSAPLRLRCGKVVGAGRHGKVFTARNEDTGEIIAMKSIPVPQGKGAGAVRGMIELLQNEIEMLRTLEHPNIVRYLGTRREGSTVQVLMEYVPGGSLKGVLCDFGPLPAGIVQAYTRQLVCALAYLHGCRVVHRDIKGANVLLHQMGGVKLADFGTAHHLGQGETVREAASTTCGTPQWMAPEVVRGEPHGAACDIWGLGATMLEMLTAEAPFAHLPVQGGLGVMRLVASTEPIPLPDDLLQGPRAVPLSCCEMLASCLQRDPARRPSAAELSLFAFLNTPPPQNALRRNVASMRSIAALLDEGERERGSQQLAATPEAAPWVADSWDSAKGTCGPLMALTLAARADTAGTD